MSSACSSRIRLALYERQRAGFSSTVASNGTEALERAAATAPDLMLLDIVLPDFDGYEVCERMKADPELSHIPIIFLSGLTEARDKVHGLRAGAVDYITKPFDPSEVLARVQAQLRISKLSRSLITANREETRGDGDPLGQFQGGACCVVGWAHGSANPRAVGTSLWRQSTVKWPCRSLSYLTYSIKYEFLQPGQTFEKGVRLHEPPVEPFGAMIMRIETLDLVIIVAYLVGIVALGLFVPICFQEKSAVTA